MSEKLLIVEDEETLCESLKRVLSKEGYHVDTVMSAEAALELIRQGYYDLIISDIILPGISGIDLLKIVKDKTPEQIIVVMTAYASLETAVDSLRAGAYDYVVKPVMHEEIKQVVKNALMQKSLQKENVILKKQIEKHCDAIRIVGESRATQQIREEIKKISNDAGNVFLTGEIGTGKKLAANALHLCGSRSGKPFIEVNCNLPADSPTEGKLIEDADGGIIFLNEVLSLGSEAQAEFLSLVSGKQNIRFIASSSRLVEPAVNNSGFSGELIKQLSGIVLELSPLRERTEDIAPLTDYFVRKYSREIGRTIKGIDDEALASLVNYQWPGNVRELKSVIERAVLISSGSDVIKLPHLPKF